MDHLRVYVKLHVREPLDGHHLLLALLYLHLRPVHAPLVSLLPMHVLHVVIMAGLGDRIAGGDGDVLPVLNIDILAYLVRLLLWNLLACFPGNTFTNLSSQNMASLDMGNST
jgi:hypothetical protein